MDKNFTPLTITGDNKIDSKKKNIFQKMIYEYKNNRHKRRTYNIIGGAALAFIIGTGLGVGLYFGLHPKDTSTDDNVYNAMKADYEAKGLDYSYDDFKQDKAAQEKKLSLDELDNKTLRAYLKQLLSASFTVKETGLYKNADKEAASQYDAAIDNGNALLNKFTDDDNSSEAHDQYIVAINDLVSTLQKLGFKTQSEISASANEGANKFIDSLNNAPKPDDTENSSSETNTDNAISSDNSQVTDDTTVNNQTETTPSFGNSDVDGGYFIPDTPDHNIDDNNISKPSQDMKNQTQKEIDEYINDPLGTKYSVEDVCNSLITQVNSYANWSKNFYGYPDNGQYGRGYFSGFHKYIRQLEYYATTGTKPTRRMYPEIPLDEQVEKLRASIYQHRKLRIIDQTNMSFDGILNNWFKQGGYTFDKINSIHFIKEKNQLGKSPLSNSDLKAEIIDDSGMKFLLYLRVGLFNGQVCYQMIDMIVE